MMAQRLFLSANFEDFSLGLADESTWKVKIQKQGYLSDQFYSVLQPLVEQCDYAHLKIFLLNGPGSTLGIRSLCAFVQTLLALKYIQPTQVYVCDHLHFAQAYGALIKRPTSICARVNLSQTLCLGPEVQDTIHAASELEKQQSLWLPHPCLPKDCPLFTFSLEAILPLLQPQFPWKFAKILDVFNPSDVK